MKMTKKLLALVLGAVMLLGLLAGCGETTPNKPNETKAPVSQVPTLTGMLVLSANATFKISYDQDGMVMEIAGNNEDSSAILAEYDYNGKSCSTVVKELIAATAKATLLRETNNIVLKLAVGSQLPSETFFDGLAKDAADAAAENASSAYVVAIGLDGLDESGYINADFAQKLLANHLGVTAFDSYNGDTEPRNDCYIVTVKAGEVAGTYSIDAVTGMISETEGEESPAEPEYIEDEEIEYIEDENVDEPVEEDIPEGTEG